MKLGDLGEAKSLANSEAATFRGTLKYMSPEMIQDESVGFKTDVWSFGIVVYELVSLEYPFKGFGFFNLAKSIKNDEIPPLNTNKIFCDLIRM